MKSTGWIVAWIGLALCTGLAAAPDETAKSAPPVDLPAAVEQQAAARAKITTEYDGRSGATKNWFLSILDGLQKDATARGSLDGVLAVKIERERADRVLTADETAALAEPIRGVRLKYDQALRTLQSQKKAREVTCIQDYVATLEALQKRLTQQGDVDNALKVREEVAQAKGQATALQGTEASSGPVPPALTPVPPNPVAGLQPPLVKATPVPVAPTAPVMPISTLGMGSSPATSHPALVGSWHFKWTETGYEADFTFAADGTFQSGKGGGPGGTWKVSGDKILMEAPGIASKTIFLPIKPKGTKVVDQRKNRLINAVKLP